MTEPLNAMQDAILISKGKKKKAFREKTNEF